MASPLLARIPQRPAPYGRRRPTLAEVVAEKAIEGALAVAVGTVGGMFIAWWLS